MTTIIGIDPGIKGAYAVVTDGRLRICGDLPTYSYSVNGKVKNRIDPMTLHVWMCEIKHDLKPEYAVIEDVHAMPGQGVTSMFNFGYTCGAIAAAVMCAGIIVKTAPASVWKRKMGLVGQDKNASRALATKLLGNDLSWPLAKHDGRAEAALLAVYGLVHGKDLT